MLRWSDPQGARLCLHKHNVSLSYLDILSSLPRYLTDNMNLESPQTSAKQALATLAQIEPNKLFTASISSATPLPYTAVLDYVSLTDSTKPSGTTDSSGCNVLSVSQFDPVLPKGLPDDLDDTKNSSGSSYIQKMNNRAFSNFKQCASSQCDIPLLSFGEGHVVVPWPIPSHLSADHLFSLRQDKTSQPREGVNCSTSTVSETADEIGPLFVAHYPLGIPQKDCSGKLIRMHELLLATTKPNPNLRDVITALTHWKEMKDRRVRSPDGYALFRLKTRYEDVYWVYEGLRRSRSPSSIILNDNLIESILEDLRNFLSPSAIQWYRHHDLPHRRSYLFTGPPGTGKTSTIRMLASKFDLACCFLTLTDKNFSNQTLAEGLSGIPSNALLVLEDVDALFVGRESRSKEGLTFSGILNVLDGVLSAEHVVVVMTTNHPERLDDALVRAGRVDRRFHFGIPGDKEILELFRRFYPSSSKEVAEKFVGIVMESEKRGARSMANLQQLFIQFRGKSGSECVDGIHEFLDNIVSGKQEDGKESGKSNGNVGGEKTDEDGKLNVELSLNQDSMSKVSSKMLELLGRA